MFNKHKSKKDNQKNDILRDNHDNDLVDEINTDNKKPKRQLAVPDALKFDKHRKMERFIMMFGCATALFVSGATYSLYHAHVNAAKQSLALNKIGDTISFSKTASGFTLGTPQLTADKTTMYLPITITDTSVISTNANNYNLFLSATQGSLGYKPTAQLMTFGPTGRAVIILHSSLGFVNQPVTMYVKNDKELNINSSTDNQGVGDTSSDASIAADQQKYDLAVFKMNFGSPQYKPNKLLANSGNTPTDIYKALYSSPDMAKIDNNVKRDKAKLPHQYAIANEMYSRLKKEGYIMPKQPTWMADDWRPYNIVNPETGQVGASHKKVSPSGAVPTIDDDSNDTSQNYADVLKKKNGSTTNSSNTGEDSINGNANNGSDANSWATLQQAWNSIKSIKSDIYVQQWANYYSIQNNLTLVNQNTSLASPSRFKLLGQVNITK